MIHCYTFSFHMLIERTSYLSFLIHSSEACCLLFLGQEHPIAISGIFITIAVYVFIDSFHNFAESLGWLNWNLKLEHFYQSSTVCFPLLN